RQRPPHQGRPGVAALRPELGLQLRRPIEDAVDLARAQIGNGQQIPPPQRTGRSVGHEHVLTLASPPNGPPQPRAQVRRRVVRRLMPLILIASAIVGCRSATPAAVAPSIEAWSTFGLSCGEPRADNVPSGLFQWT